MSKATRKQEINPPMLLTALLTNVFKRHLVTIAFAMLTLISAFILIVMTHSQRKLYAELEQLHTERNELDIEWRQLRVEQRVWADHTRLENVAKEQLDMKNLDVKSERIVRQVNEEDN